MSYKIKLDIFEGPLDLLLHLIKKNDIDIYDIPITKITDQYLQYLDFMKMLDLDVAGEFLVIAATLMQIKSKMLLPPDEIEELGEEEEDPREELVKKLIEYKKFKEAAAHLSEIEQRRKDIFTRSGEEILVPVAENKGYFETGLFDLIYAFSKALKEISKEEFHKIIEDNFTVSQKIHDILHMLVNSPIIKITSLFKKARAKTEIIAFFLAILELIKQREIIIFQRNIFGEIEIKRNESNITPYKVT